VPVFAPPRGSRATAVGDPVEVARGASTCARVALHDVVIVDTAGRLGIDAELMQQAATSATPCSPTRSSSSSTR
jgi:signal recognition particle subunit SRP54